MRRRNDDNRTTLRTRAHRIADLSRHHFEGFVLRCGHTVESLSSDYGYDLYMSTFDYSRGDDGEYENTVIPIQLKATDSLTTLADGETIVYRVRREHTRLWRGSLHPVFLIVYDAQNEVAYWLDVRAFLRTETAQAAMDQATYTVHIPKSNIVNEDAIETFRRIKNEQVRFLESIENAGNENVS
jgi:hypothetical protein